jgi:hypothetical protein
MGGPRTCSDRSINNLSVPKYNSLPEELTNFQSYFANPIDIPDRSVAPSDFPDLTSVILSYLKPLSSECTRNASPCHAKVATLLDRLPNEIIDLIIDSMWPIGNLPVQCTRIMGPSRWQKLFTKKFLPYLWDLDRKVIRDFLCSHNDQKWDFELLVRQLAQEGIWEHWKKMDGATEGSEMLGIWNRRRIWRLVERMEVGNVK